MSRFRFSMGSFLGAITLLALGLAAVVSQSTWGASLAYTAFLLLVGLATTLAIAGGSNRRLFCAGFAVFGWLYWFTEFKLPTSSMPQELWTTGLSSGVPRPESSEAGLGPGLVTRELITFLETNLTSNRPVGAQVMAELSGGGYYPGTIVATRGGQYEVEWVDGTRQWTPPNLIWSDPAGTRVACHSLLGGLFALVGAILATLLGAGQSPAFSPSPSGRGPG